MPLSTTNIRIVSVSIPYHSPIVLLSFSYCSPIVLLSFSYCSPIGKAETIRKQYGNNTESNGGWTNEERWNKGGLSYFYRNFLWQWQDSNKLLWVYATKWFSNNTSDNVRYSAVKYLYAEGSCSVLWGRHQKETSQNRLLLTPEKSLTLKLYRSPTNNSDGIFSVSSFVRFSFGSRSVLVRFSIDSRSSFVHPPFILRSGIEERSKIDRRTNGESSEAKRRCIETLMGSQGKGDPNKNFILIT